MPSNQVEALLQRARAGDGEAFEQLIEPHVGRLYNYLARMVGDPADAEDLTQDVILRAHRAIGSFRGGATFQTWLYRIATNIAVDALRRRGRRNARVTSLDDPLQAEQGLVAREVRDTQRDPQRLAEASELIEQVQNAIAELSPKLRAVVVLFDIQGLTYDEIAQTLRLPLGTVKSRLFNARTRLRELLEPYVAGAA
ncbi:MAG: sigma-70 family RNA polymerase sigma factor [Armatimonadetes bacterium]|nr:sigma-70 family RNA polymerase sigma factor [Armatimonadota bacterium]